VKTACSAALTSSQMGYWTPLQHPLFGIMRGVGMGGLLDAAIRAAAEAGSAVATAVRSASPGATAAVFTMSNGFATGISRIGAGIGVLISLAAIGHRYQEDPVTRADYHLRVPGRAGLMTLAFATPLEPLAGPLTLLFDAVAESLRWKP
jgi:hypothetical protein